MVDGVRAQHLEIDQKWDRVIDVGLRRLVYGSLAGGVAALILFRKLQSNSCEAHHPLEIKYQDLHARIFTLSNGPTLIITYLSLECNSCIQDDVQVRRP